MKVREIMTSPVITVGPDATFAEIVELLLDHDVSGVPVVDADDHLLGIVTEADLVSKEAYGYERRRALGLIGEYLRGHDPQWVRKASGRSAAELMTSDPSTAGPDDDLALAARRMLEGGHKRLPVIDEDRLVGIVTRHDLLEPFGRGDAAVAADVDALLERRVRVPETHHAHATVTAGVVTLTGDVQWPSDISLVEAVVARVPGVVAVDNQLRAREPEPILGDVRMPPFS